MNDTIRQLRIKLDTHLILQNRSQEYANGYNDACSFFDELLDEVEQNKKLIPKDIVKAKLVLEKEGDKK